MENASCIRVYEEPSLLEMDGGAIRPGGLELTGRAFRLHPLPPGSLLLDAGCGAGASLAWLQEKNGYRVLGIDLSRRLLAQAAARNEPLHLLQGQAARLPLPAALFDGLLAECSLSLMDDAAAALAEFKRVLKPGGLLVLSDVYVRQPQHQGLLRALPFHSCLCGACSREQLFAALEENDLQIEHWEDHTAMLKTFAARLIFRHGSLSAFWGCAAAEQASACDLQQAVHLAKPGYYLCVVRKRFVPE